MEHPETFARSRKLKPLPYAFFTEILTVSPDDLPSLQAYRLEVLLREGWNPSLGAKCSASSGRTYLYGPRFEEHTNAWQNFVMGTRGKRSGMVFHYSHVDDPSPGSAWTNYSSRHRIRMPLDEASARSLAKVVNETPSEKALVFSGSLLADLLLWADSRKVKLARDVVWTTFEVFPRAMTDRLLASFPDWCDYMRSWDGGLTYWRCRFGRYHTLDNATILTVSPAGTAVVTDLSNKAQRFVDYETDDLVSVGDRRERCRCGVVDRGFEHLGSSSWALQTKSGEARMVADPSTLPPGVQIYQHVPGKLTLLRPDPWTSEDERSPQVARIIADGSWDVDLRQGFFRRGDKKPPVFSSVGGRRRRIRFGGGYLPEVNLTAEKL